MLDEKIKYVKFMYTVSCIDSLQLSSMDPLSSETGIHRLDCKTLLFTYAILELTKMKPTNNLTTFYNQQF